MVDGVGGTGAAGGSRRVLIPNRAVVQDVDVATIDPSPYQPRRRFAADTLASLAENIREHGLVNPILCRSVGERFELVAGERRWRAYRLLAEADAAFASIPATVRALSDHEAQLVCLSENLQRDDLTKVEEIEGIARWVDARMSQDAEWQPWLRAMYGRVRRGPQTAFDLDNPVDRATYLLVLRDSDRKHGTQEIGDRFIANCDAAFADLSQPIQWDSFVANDLPIIRNMPQLVKDAAIELKLNKSQADALKAVHSRAPEKITAVIDKGEATVFDRSQREFTTAKLADMSAREIAALVPEKVVQTDFSSIRTAPPVPEGRYRCIVIDPPWPVQKIEREQRPHQGAELDYPTMSEDEIRTRIADELRTRIAADGCHLYLWVTQRYLPLGLELTEAWGFRYQCLLTWVKPTGMTPYSWMYNTEHVIFARQGGVALTRLGLKLAFDAPVVRHSEKPTTFYDLVRQASPGPRLAMFERKPREGFTVWGNEVTNGVA